MADDFILFKDDRLKREWESGSLDPTVQLIVREASEFAATHLQWPFVLTSIWRSQGEDIALAGSGVHPAWRAVDVRTLDRSQYDVDVLTAFVNGRWVYDPLRPNKVVCYTAEHGNAKHAHFQCYSRTCRREAARSS